MGRACLWSGDLAGARGTFRDVLAEIADKPGNTRLISSVLCEIAAPAHAARSPEQGARLLGAVAAAEAAERFVFVPIVEAAGRRRPGSGRRSAMRL